VFHCARGGRTTLEVKNIIQLDDILVDIGGLSLTTLTKTDEIEVIQLAAKGGERRMVEIARQYLRLNQNTIMNNDAAQKFAIFVFHCKGTDKKNGLAMLRDKSFSMCG
jgi:hypothetical protein